MATRDFGEAEHMGEVDRILQDVDLLGQAREDVDRGIRDDQRIVMTRNIHDEAMAEPPRGAQAAVALDDGAHQLVGVQTALHQRLRAAFADQLDCPLRGGAAVVGLDDRMRRNVQSKGSCGLLDEVARPDQNWLDQPKTGRVQRAFERALVARMGDGNPGRAGLLRPGDQAIIFFMLAST